jgi:hypothetical protein
LNGHGYSIAPRAESMENVSRGQRLS